MLTLVPLLVACINVGLLIFARTAARTSGFAVRTALGASRARILVTIALVACTAPTLRALRISPADALRGDGL